MTEKTIYAALAKAQAEMTRAEKSAENPHFRKKYADLGAVQEACLPALHKHGFAVYQPLADDGSGVLTILAHESGETLSCKVPFVGGMPDMQKLGSAITYARRYGLMTMAGIAPEDDDGNAAAAGAKEAKQQAYQDKLARDRALLEAAENRDTLVAQFGRIYHAWNKNPPDELVELKNALKEKFPEPEETDE